MKKNILMYGIILILACALTGTITFILMDKKANKETVKNDYNYTEQTEDKGEDNSENTISLIKTIVVDDKILQEFEVILNNQKKTIPIVYTYKYTEATEYEGAYEEIIGAFNNEEVVYNFEIANTSKKATKLTKEFINQNFNINNFNIIKGTDNKDYLAISTNKNSGLYVKPSNSLYIYNENLEQIVKDIPSYNGCETDNYLTILSGSTGYELEDENKWYQDAFNLCDKDTPCHIGVKIEANKIYYITPPTNLNNLDSIQMEEREYAIHNNRLEYKVINTFKTIGPVGQVC